MFFVFYFLPYNQPAFGKPRTIWTQLVKPESASHLFKHLEIAAMDHDRRNKQPRMLTEAERDRLEEFIESIHYSSRYSDDVFEYRHVQLPKEMVKKIPKDYFDPLKGTLKLLWEEEWRGLGITQSLGWEHYEVHEPEPHILLFKRPINYQAPVAH